jgi:predicted small secreted protein
MRKALIILMLVFLIAVTITSCATAKKGCFATSKMIGYD